MMGFDSPDHHRHHSQELLADCCYTRVFASRVGALGTSIVRAAKPGDFTCTKRKKPPRDESSVPRFPQGKLREFTLEELGKATANFSSEGVLGRGGFGHVFKGILSDGEVVAVKVLNPNNRHGLEQFQAEMRASCAIMGISHPNLVPAIGYHTSRKRKMAKIMIVYPFMANGDGGLCLCDLQPSLLTPLDWTTRKRIALGVARGICCLHELGIIHRDIKPANVMLDEDFNARVGDLGLALFRDLPLNSDNAMGFHGDVDSHLWDHSGKLLFDMSEEGGNQSPLYWAKQLLENEEGLTRLMHPGMLGMYDEGEAIELIRVGLVCAQDDPKKRPLMPEVIAMMEGSSANLVVRWEHYQYDKRHPESQSWLVEDDVDCTPEELSGPR